MSDLSKLRKFPNVESLLIKNQIEGFKANLAALKALSKQTPQENQMSDMLNNRNTADKIRKLKGTQFDVEALVGVGAMADRLSRELINKIKAGEEGPEDIEIVTAIRETFFPNGYPKD